MMKSVVAARRVVSLAVALIAATECHAAATVALDNTAGGTATLSGNNYAVTTTLWRVRVFTVGASNVSISSMKMGLYSTQVTSTNITWELYLVDSSNNPTGSALASDTQSVSFTSAGGSSSRYYDFTAGGSLATYSMQAGQKYGLLFKSNATTLSWTPTTTNTVYSPGSSGFAYVANRVTSNSGTSYSGNSTYNAWSMTVNAASAVPGTGLAAIGGFGLAGMRRRRR